MSTDKAAVADAIRIEDIMRKATREAEKSSKLSPVFLKRDSFARTAISTGCLCLDWKMGGGIPPGRIVGISGPERAGKTLLVTQILFNQVSTGGFGKLHDAEGSTDPLFLKARGIDFDKFRGKRKKDGSLKDGEVDYIDFYQPTTIQEFAGYVQTLSSLLPENRNPDRPLCIHVLDSVVALITDALEEDIDANKMAYHARMYSEYIPLVNACLVKSGCTLIYTNQLRQKPGVKFGNPIYEPCGDTLKFFSSIRLMLNPFKPKLDDGDHPFLTKEMIPGVEVREGGIWEEPHYTEKGDVRGLDKYIYTGIKTVKNKVYTPYQGCWMRINFEENGSTGSGLDPVFDIFTFLYETGYIRPATGVSTTGKEKTIKGFYSVQPCKKLDPIKEFNMPEKFDYYEFKKWVHSRSDLVMALRERMLVSGLVYEKEEEEPAMVIDDITDEELEEQALAEVEKGLEDLEEETKEIKKRGRKKREV